jgi:hypothetical protein
MTHITTKIILEEHAALSAMLRSDQAFSANRNSLPVASPSRAGLRRAFHSHRQRRARADRPGCGVLMHGTRRLDQRNVRRRP